MARRVQMSVDPNFKKLVRELNKEKGLSDREITKELANEITGRSLFEKDDRKKKRFNL